jgi:hypothetical protein
MKKIYAPFMDAEAIKATESADACRAQLEKVRNAWNDAGNPRGGDAEKSVSVAFAAWEDATRHASFLSRIALHEFLSK